MIKVLVCGSRKTEDQNYVNAELDSFIISNNINVDDLLIIQGGGTGIDALVREYCRVQEIACVNVPATWNRFKQEKKFVPSAGPIRNTKMLDWFSPSIVLSFPGGTGTEDMRKQAIARKIQVEKIG